MREVLQTYVDVFRSLPGRTELPESGYLRKEDDPRTIRLNTLLTKDGKAIKLPHMCRYKPNGTVDIYILHRYAINNYFLKDKRYNLSPKILFFSHSGFKGNQIRLENFGDPVPFDLYIEIKALDDSTKEFSTGGGDSKNRIWSVIPERILENVLTLDLETSDSRTITVSRIG